MHIEFLKENVEEYLSLFSKILPIHSQIPVLANLLIEANKQGIFISSTNLEIGIKVKIAGKVTTEGATTVPGKQFIEVVLSLPADRVEMVLEKESLKLSCRGNTVSFQTIARDEFPGLFEDRGEEVIVFSAQDLRDAFSGLIFAASMDESRPELTGILLSQKDSKLDLVATDGFRLSLKTIVSKMSEETLIIPAKLIAESMSLKDKISLYVNKKANQVIFETEDVVLVGRVIAGNFPNYGKVIPTTSKTIIHFDAAEMAQKLKLISIFARDTANVVKVKIEGGRMTMHAAASGVGQGDIELEGKQEGEENEIAFNVKFLMDFLKNTSAKEISMQVSSPIEPALFKVDNDPDFLHVIMPVRI